MLSVIPSPLPSFLAASVFCAATPAGLAALQPIAEAPLAGETEFRCQFNADNSTDCVSTYSFTILKPSGREMLSRIDRSYAETDSLIVEKAELTQPGGKPVPLDQSQIDTRTAPNPDQGFCANARPPGVPQPARRHPHQLHPARALHRQAAEHPVPLHPQPPADAGARRPLRRRVQGRAADLRAQRVDGRLSHRTERRQEDPQGQPEKSRNTPTTSTKPATPTCAIPRAWSWAVRWTCRTTSARSPRATTRSSPRSCQGRRGGRRRGEGQAGPRAGRRPDAVHQRHLPLPGRLARQRARLRALLLAEIERNGYGDCKDPAILLAAMLKAAGIKAEPTLVSRGDVVWDLLVPGMYAPNHAIVRAEVDGKTWWLDPTNPVFAPGRTMPTSSSAGRWCWAPTARVRRVEIPLKRPATPCA